MAQHNCQHSSVEANFLLRDDTILSPIEEDSPSEFSSCQNIHSTIRSYGSILINKLQGYLRHAINTTSKSQKRIRSNELLLFTMQALGSPVPKEGKVRHERKSVKKSFIHERQSKEECDGNCEALHRLSSITDNNTNDNSCCTTTTTEEKFLRLVCTYCSPRKRLTARQHFSRILILFAILIQVCSQFYVCSAQKLIFKGSNNPATSIVIPHIKYGQGLNRWSFLSVDRDNHGLHSDLLCPNPMIGPGTGVFTRTGVGGGGMNRMNTATGGRGRQQQMQYPQTTQNRFPGSPSQQPLPNEIWALKTEESLSLLPCGLRQRSVPTPPFNTNSNNKGSSMVMVNAGSGGVTRHNNGHFIENRILFINVSLVPFNFHGAIPCSKYIKLMYDEEEGTNLRCRNIPFDNNPENKYHINWPENHLKRKEYWSLRENLERFLQNEQNFHRQFYFQVYFTSFNGRSKRCTVQQYELDLSYPAGNARFCNLTQSPNGQEELCGEFDCDDLIFPLYTDPQPHSSHDGGRRRGMSEEEEDDYDDEDYEDEETSHEHDSVSRSHHPTAKDAAGIGSGHNEVGQTPYNDQFSWSRMIRLDIRLLIFITIVPLVLFGVLVFGLELIIYFMCCRKLARREETEEERERSQAILQNSLNVWENVPSRDAQRTVSFSPMTTSIYGERKNMMMDSASLESQPDTPKILKSALKKHGEHSSPTSAAHHYFEYDHDMPPSYIETTNR